MGCGYIRIKVRVGVSKLLGYVNLMFNLVLALG